MFYNCQQCGRKYEDDPTVEREKRLCDRCEELERQDAEMTEEERLGGCY